MLSRGNRGQSGPLMWSRAILAAAIAVACATGVAHAQVTPQARVTLSKRGFTTADFADLAALRRAPSLGNFQSWYRCNNRTAGFYIVGGTPIDEARGPISMICANEEAKLRAGLIDELGARRGQRLMALLRADLQLDIEEAYAREAPQGLAPTPAVLPAQRPDNIRTGTWSFLRQGRVCLATLTYKDRFGYSVIVGREGADVTVAFNDIRVSDDQLGKRLNRTITYFYPNSRSDQEASFLVLDREGHTALALELTPETIAKMDRAQVVWIGRLFQYPNSPVGNYFALPSFASVVDRLATC